MLVKTLRLDLFSARMLSQRSVRIAATARKKQKRRDILSVVVMPYCHTELRFHTVVEPMAAGEGPLAMGHMKVIQKMLSKRNTSA
tara:strand:+ start:344 stop:598 length:255 start_codon:yes stop_codon:yes gene_type:complete